MTQETKTSNMIIFRSDERGRRDHGWLKARHSFSFADYYDPQKVNFGALRVLNDDIIEGGKGFGMHPHANMEIITIMLEGELKHNDNMGFSSVIKPGDIQIMSAGSGIMHSEYNNLPDTKINLLQIWVFPKIKNIAPRYDQKFFEKEGRQNTFQLVVSPDEAEGSLRINQDACFLLAEPDAGKTLEYKLRNKNHGVYTFIIEGKIYLNGHELNKRDAAGVINSEKNSFTSIENSTLLLIEVPMAF